jgi:hypothetical protein
LRVHGLHDSSLPRDEAIPEGFHLSLETWRGGCNSEGWKLPKQQEQEKIKAMEVAISDNFHDFKLDLLMHSLIGGDGHHDAPSSGFTQATP